MRNSFLIYFLLFINVSFSLKEAKDFLIEFLKSTSNNKIIDNLSEKCFGKIFDYHFLLLQKSYIENNYENTSKHLENMGLDIIINCPIYEIIKMFKETEYEIFSPIGYKFKSKIYTKLIILSRKLYLKFNNNTLSGVSLGGILGKIVNLFKFDYNALYELESEDVDDNTEIDLILDNINKKLIDFISGIFMGIKEKDDGKESKCFRDIINEKKKLLNIFENALKKMKTGKSFSEILKSISFQLVTVEGLTVDCNLLSLGNSILGKVSSIKELTKVFYKTIQNSRVYIVYFKQFIEKLKKNRIKEAGTYVGKIISNIFDFNLK